MHRPIIDYVLCNNCTTCTELCLYKAIYIDSIDGYVKIDYAKCKNCGICIRICPYGAIRYSHNKNQWVPTTSSIIRAD